MNMRKQSIDILNPQEKLRKERDIIICLADAKTEEVKEKFSEQLEYVCNAIAKDLQITFNFDEKQS